MAHDPANNVQPVNSAGNDNDQSEKSAVAVIRSVNPGARQLLIEHLLSRMADRLMEIMTNKDAITRRSKEKLVLQIKSSTYNSSRDNPAERLLFPMEASKGTLRSANSQSTRERTAETAAASAAYLGRTRAKRKETIVPPRRRARSNKRNVDMVKPMTKLHFNHTGLRRQSARAALT
jgi:hypothetical protein